MRLILLVWLAAIGVAVAFTLIWQDPFNVPADAIALTGLVVLFGRELWTHWRWLNLAVRRVMLWVTNEAVAWSACAKLTPAEALDCDQFERLEEVVRDAAISHAMIRMVDDIIFVEDRRGLSIQIRATEALGESLLTVSMSPARIGYRDSVRVIREEFLPIVDAISQSDFASTAVLFSIEARFRRTNPYAAVLLAEFHPEQVDSVVIHLSHKNDNVVVTKNAVEASTSSRTNIESMLRTVFGVSLQGAISADNL
jgi:hypothetical protein